MRYVVIFVYFDSHDECFCGRFLNCCDSGKKPGRSLLNVGVEEALKDAGFDEKAFLERGGIFDWGRSDSEEAKVLEW
jgi:radical S-adenosyl methionine domain-containing protein 2